MLGKIKSGRLGFAPHQGFWALRCGLLLLSAWSCSKKISPNIPDPFPDLHVVSVSPADHTLNVPASTDAVLTFSQQMNLGTIGIVMAPMPADFYTNLSLSSDLRQLLARADLSPNNSYSLVVYSAVDRYADVLRVPFASRFHTANVAPTGSVNGKAAAPFNAPTQGFVALLRKSPETIIASSQPDADFSENLAAVSSIQDVTGAYEITAVPSGIYWPVAVLDVNRNGRVDLQHDRLSGYDANADARPDSVTVASAAVSAVALNTPVESFRVQSYLPAQGALNLGTRTEFRLTFSAALDTNKLGLFVSPEPAGFSKASLILSADAKSISSFLDLQPNAPYSALLFAANSTQGQVLRTPLLIQFASGASFPSGEVSGQVAFGLGADSTQYTLVGLLRQDVPQLLLRVIGGGESVNKVLGSALEVMSYAPDGSGTFTLSNVRDGTYWPVAAKDFNGNGAFDLGADPIGIFDGDGDGVASVGDSVVVHNGNAVRNLIIKRLF